MASIVAFASAVAVAQTIQEYPVPKGAHPNDIAPAADGGVWYTAQHQAALGWWDPKTGKTRHISLTPVDILRLSRRLGISTTYNPHL